MDQENIIHSQEAAQAVIETPGKDILSSGIINSGITALDAVKWERVVVYTITDPLFGKFEVMASSYPYRLKAWWEDKHYVQKLIDAFKAGHLVKDAKFYAGITQPQWEHFNEQHPDFLRVREACEAFLTFRAMNTVGAALETDPHIAMQYLKATHEKFKPKVKVETDGPLSQTTNNLIIGNVDSEKIAQVLARAVERFDALGAGTSGVLEGSGILLEEGSDEEGD